MISVIIPAANAAAQLGPTLDSLVNAAVSGLVGEVVIACLEGDADTVRIADAWGAKVAPCGLGRGVALRAGAAAARKPWLLFLHADTRLSAGWEAETEEFIAGQVDHAAAFTFKLADRGMRPRLVEAGVALRARLFALPYGDQGLLISRRFHDEIGGFRPMPIMEDVDIIRRIGRSRLTILRAAAITSAQRYQRDGYVRRVARNWACIAMYPAGVPPERIAKFYERPPSGEQDVRSRA
jgi:rSAM/selenodomain-associated transferase 2